MIIKGKDSYDNHMISSFTECPMRYAYSIELGLRPRVVDDGGAPDGSTTALDFGIAFHLGVETWRVTGDINLALTKATESFKDKEPPNETKRTLVKLTELLELYMTYYSNDGWRVLTSWVEKGFHLPLAHDIQYCGRVDVGLSRISNPEERVISDIKTSSAPHLFLANPHSQFTGYIWGGRQLLSGMTGLLVDLIGVFKGKPVKGKNGDWLQGKGPADVFFRYLVTRKDWEIEKWKQDVVKKVSLIRESRDSGQWLMNSASCMSWGRLCPYHVACITPETNRGEILNSDMFEFDPWYPLPEMREAYRSGIVDKAEWSAVEYPGKNPGTEKKLGEV